MRRKKDRSIYPCQSMTRPMNVRTIATTITANTVFWLSAVSLCCAFTYVLCDDAATFNSKLSTFSGHVKSTTPPMQPEFFTNHSAHIIDDEILSSNQSSSLLQKQRRQQQQQQQQQHKGRTFVRSGNELWDGLVNDCMAKPSFSCFQKNIYKYLDDTLRLADVNVTDRILFKKIDIDPNLLAQLQNTTEDDHDNEVSASETREFKSGLSSLVDLMFLIMEKVVFYFASFLAVLFRIADRRGDRCTLRQMANIYDDPQCGIENAGNPFRWRHISHYAARVRRWWGVN